MYTHVSYIHITITLIATTIITSTSRYKKLTIGNLEAGLEDGSRAQPGRLGTGNRLDHEHNDNNIMIVIITGFY